MTRRLRFAGILLSCGVLSAGCGESPAAERDRDAPRADRVSTRDARVLDAISHVPPGYEYITEPEYESDPRGRPPGTVATFVHRGDCCDADDDLQYPPTVLLRKFPDAGTVDQVVELRRREARSVPGFVDGSFEAVRHASTGGTWRRVSYRIDAEGDGNAGQLPVLQPVAYVERRAGLTFEFAVVTAEQDAFEVAGDVERMLDGIDWSALPVEDF